MLFNSLHFLIFFPVVVCLHFFLPHRKRWAFLLLASSYFYLAFIPKYLLILYALIFVDYVAALAIARAVGKKKRQYLIFSIFANLGTLFVFKYFNFFSDNIAVLAAGLHWNYPLRHLSLLLPIGLSFHTFQSLSYVIEVYRGNQLPERHLGIYALYVMFFPQLVAGPIERPQHMLHQFREEHFFDGVRITSGLRLMLWGFFKKLVIADNAAIAVDHVFSISQNASGAALLIATVLFSFQIYCDFSGYSDIAVGSARVLGFRLTKNFSRPYLADSIAEFWRRWHISLTSWLRDYLYIPLGGNRVTRLRRQFNVMATFLASGLWHGASWTFIVWGGLNGAYLILASLTATVRLRAPRPLRILTTFLLVSFAWIFFRAESLRGAFYVLNKITSTAWFKPFFSNAEIASSFVQETVAALGINFSTLYVLIISVTILIGVELLQESGSRIFVAVTTPLYIRLLAYYALIFFVFFFGVSTKRPFIYFQF